MTPPGEAERPRKPRLDQLLVERACAGLEPFAGKAELLRQVARFVIERRH